MPQCKYEMFAVVEQTMELLSGQLVVEIRLNNISRSPLPPVNQAAYFRVAQSIRGLRNGDR